MHSADRILKPSPRLRLDDPTPLPRDRTPHDTSEARSVRRGPAIAAQPPQRVASVDALRGFSMVWILGADVMAVSLRSMLAGQTPMLAAAGDALATQLEHVAWEGLTFYDLVFPLFIFVTGVSIVFSLPRLVETEGKAAAYARVLRRSALLFALGVICYGGLSRTWPDIRLLGVLQRIALCYLFASLLFLNLGWRGLLWAFAGLMVGYWALMTFVPVPGIGAGSFEKEANLAFWIDARYLPGRMWEETWDPEGLLSTLPAIGTCLLGVFAGLLLRDPRFRPEQVSLLLVGGGAALVAAGLLWSVQFPIIKSLWTSSFVLVTGGLSAILLGAFHQVMDVWRIRDWATVLLWIGASAIVLYVLDSIVGFERLAVRVVGGDVGSWLDRTFAEGTGRFVAHAAGLGLAILLARFLYARRIFLRL